MGEGNRHHLGQNSRRLGQTVAYFSTCTDCILDDGTKIEQWMFCESCDASGRVHDTHPLKVVPLNARDSSSALGFRPGRYRLTAGLGLFKTKKDTRNTDFLSALSLGAVEESIRLTDATYIDVEETQQEETGTTWGLTPGGWAKLYDARLVSSTWRMCSSTKTALSVVEREQYLYPTKMSALNAITAVACVMETWRRMQ